MGVMKDEVTIGAHPLAALIHWTDEDNANLKKGWHALHPCHEWRPVPHYPQTVSAESRPYREITAQYGMIRREFQLGHK